jgi:hypothetical protein
MWMKGYDFLLQDFCLAWNVVLEAFAGSDEFTICQGCSRGLERLGLETFFTTSRSRLVMSTPRSCLGLDT